MQRAWFGARYMQHQANNWGTTSAHLAFCLLQHTLYGPHTSRPFDSEAMPVTPPPLLYCEQLPRFTAVVVAARWEVLCASC
jgi:hypothetical protein